ncbi:MULTISPECIES: protein-L-isoaspartate O-methyltransferase [unclassified Bradyrhizobium]|uniref:protein-L-isoaspartate O-methyltransferase family protein n=1 Tax=unclassified Bradyrhizobium TaxID=2631580 RepID=UPI001BAC26D8|nr:MULTISPECIES: protein-L-isoaspartate O-methyltransferase [unclassified Bradyrhizobium]MBR1206900.1 protein-L-isoaspartate O-methyltransferase [Bradyrhizobium sp. AUGA SZCCT0124]MBR1313439.1 protein-L-isoaspartate O-methyltransferase [Bradyrhizobium sp. AUGA SZCCT0051]MBR1343464.1 protein-L-isoaspartate O-methyltransferase [Bradyrhizobium sp. AUGA SZCCT0105]MBR1357116.1 protein-L-isoaspartate O-methyltransferase [Bradyrhizobium sp. AUGA SZCCT0045]
MTGFSTARQYMVDGQVRPSDVTDDRILEAMLTVPREVFVPAGKQALAYLDLDLDVTEGGTARRCLITPALLARMLQAAEIKATDRVLVVGCATGYAAAIVARFAGEVSATESDPALAAKASAAFAQLGIQNVTVKTAAAADGDAAGAPYDVIVLNGATEVIPTGLFGQLKEGGRLVGVFGLTPPPRATLVTHSHGDFGHRELFDATAPVLPGFERVPAFVF